MHKSALNAIMLILAVTAGCSKEQESKQAVDTTLPGDKQPSREPVVTKPALVDETSSDEMAGADAYVDAGSTEYEQGGARSRDDDASTLEKAIPDRQVSPKGDPGSWITSDDYPPSALREGVTGVTGFRLTVRTDGRVADCEIVSSSGSDLLDEATCRSVTRRARFSPATQDGQPVESTYASRVRWSVPN